MQPIPLNSWRVIVDSDIIGILKPGYKVPFNWNVRTFHDTEAQAIEAAQEYQDSLDFWDKV